MMQHLPLLILVTALGGCIGSFLNVVIYRVPLGRSLVTPPSSCPVCGHRLAWFENVPVLGWLWLCGKCRHCKAPISVQYPLIEALCAALFVGLYWVDYISVMRPQFHDVGLATTWPMFAMQLMLISGLLASTVIDARLYIIPIRIPQLVTLAALLGLPAAALWLPSMEHVAPAVGAKGVGVALGASVGLAISILLLHFKVLPRSFDDDIEESPQEIESPEAFLAYPHARREVLKECLFIAWPVIGGVLGGFAMSKWQAQNGALACPLAVRVLGGVVLGYFAGAGIVWAVRILGTLGFGKEAMGLGDVHLLAGVGAVMGAVESVLVFFIAPFFGLAGAVIFVGLQRLLKRKQRIIPYGPYLAAATLLVMVFKEPILGFLNLLNRTG